MPQRKRALCLKSMRSMDEWMDRCNTVCNLILIVVVVVWRRFQGKKRKRLIQPDCLDNTFFLANPSADIHSTILSTLYIF